MADLMGSNLVPRPIFFHENSTSSVCLILLKINGQINGLENNTSLTEGEKN